MTEDDNLLLSPQAQEINYQLAKQEHIKEVKYQCEGLVEDSKRILVGCQKLRQDFKAMMAEQRALQRDLEKRITLLKNWQGRLLEYQVGIEKYLKEQEKRFIFTLPH